MSQETPHATWTAPGRVNLIGEHVDYNGGTVLPIAIESSVTARVSLRDDGRTVVTSDAYDAPASYRWPDEDGPVDTWAAYAIGVVWAWAREYPEVRRLAADGFSIDLTSDLPPGAGLASSAATTCAVAASIAEVAVEHPSPRGLIDLARHAENDFVGVPTGLMDQTIAVLAEAGHALAIDCATLRTQHIPFNPESAGLGLLLIDTGVRHKLATSAYGERRHECERAAHDLGIEHLAQATPEQLGRLDGNLRRRAEHVVSEQARVGAVVANLEAGRIADIGASLTASHLSLRDDFEVSCPELDAAVDASLAQGALGARMTGGGFGGTAIALCRAEDVDDVTRSVGSAFTERGWAAPTVRAATASRGLHRSAG